MSTQNALQHSVIFSNDDISCGVIDGALQVASLRFKASADKYSLQQFEDSKALGMANIFFVELKDDATFFQTLKLVDFLRQKYGSVPVMVFTDSANQKTMNGAFSAGADDFMEKPLDKGEVSTRSFYRMERRVGVDVVGGNYISLGDLHLNIKSMALTGEGGKTLVLTRKQYLIISTLFHSGSTIVSRSLVAFKAWGSIKVGKSAFEKQIFELRTKLSQVSSDYEIKSYYGKGLRLMKKGCDLVSQSLELDNIRLKIVPEPSEN